MSRLVCAACQEEGRDGCLFCGFGPKLIDPSLKPGRGNTAMFSLDLTYRYWLDRQLGGTRPLVDCGLNPSTADAEEDDNTIRKGVKFAKAWGCGLFVKVNLEAYRTTYPKVLAHQRKIGTDVAGLGDSAKCIPSCRVPGYNDARARACVGSLAFDSCPCPCHATYNWDIGNDAWIDRAVRLCLAEGGIFLAAWGTNADPARVRHVVNNVIAGRVPIMCIKANQDGSPVHYLYQRDDSTLQPWTMPT